MHCLLLPIAVKYPWEYGPLAKALNELSLSILPFDSRILVLAPFSQHFPTHPHGLYENFTSVKSSNESICTAHSTPYGASVRHHDTVLFQNAMTKVNSRWRDNIGFFESTTIISAPWHDLHPESKSYGWPVDCTHYAFQPLMFEEVWHSLSDYLKQDHKWKFKMKKEP